MPEAYQTETLDRSKAPKPGPLAKVTFPKPLVRTLSNGLTIYIVQNHEQPIVSAALYVRAGSVHDPADKEGLVATVSDMLTKGTATRNAIEIAEEIDFIGGSLHASASWDTMTVGVTVLSRFLEQGFTLLADVIQNSVFPQEELDRVKLQRLASLRHAKADAGFLGDLAFSKLVFPDHPYSQQASGTEFSVERMTRDDLTAFYQRYFGPNNAFLVAAGDVDPDAFVQMLERMLGTWQPVSFAAPTFEIPTIAVGRQVGLIEKEGAVQSAIRVGHVGIARNTPDFIPLSALNMLLGGYFNSRINLNLREKHGFTYGARSYFDARLLPGPFVVSTEVRTEVTVRAIEEIIHEVTRIATEPVTEEELTMVKNYMIGSFPLQIETPQQVANRVAMLVLYGLEPDYYDTYRDKLAALTRDDLMRVATHYLRPNDLTIVASGNIQALQPAMSEFGKVHIVTADGALTNASAPVS